ncbi:AAA-like domain-containing protein [Microcoleus sp. D3_18_C4]
MEAFKWESMGLVNLQGNLATVSCEFYRQYFGDRLK